MVRQLMVALLEPVLKQPLDGLRRAFVQLSAALQQQRVVRHVLGQGVLKRILRLRKGRLLVDELPLLQMRQASLHFRLRLAHHLREQTQGKLFADDGQDLQQGLVVRRQPIHARRQDTLHRRRQLYGRQGPGQGDPGDLAPDSALPPQDPLLQQGLDQLLHEKGVAFRPRQNELF